MINLRWFRGCVKLMENNNLNYDNNKLNEWDRINNESAKAYAAFCAYRDYGIDRSATKVLQRYNNKYGSRSMLTRWSNKHNWVNRCYEYDVYMEKEQRKELHSYNIKMIKRHAEQSMLLQSKAIEALINIDPKSLSNQELLRYIEVGMKLERDTIGYANDNKNAFSEGIEKKEEDIMGARVNKDFKGLVARALAMRYPT